MATESRQKRYRALEQIAGLLTGLAVLGYLIAMLWVWAVYSTSSAQSSPGVSVLVGLLPSLYVAGLSLFLHAGGQIIRLAIDCATHLATIADSVALTTHAHPVPAADPLQA